MKFSIGDSVKFSKNKYRIIPPRIIELIDLNKKYLITRNNENHNAFYDIYDFEKKEPIIFQIHEGFIINCRMLLFEKNIKIFKSSLNG